MDASDIVPKSDREILLELRRDVKNMNVALNRELASQTKRSDDFESRLRALERFRWWLMGAIVGSAGLSAALAAAVTHVVETHAVPGVP
jgi:hypothetical protein